MPSNKGSAAPSSVTEGIQGIASAVNAAMMAPDAGPYLKFLDGLLKATLGAIHGGQKGPPQPGGPGGAPGGQPGMPQGGGMNLNQLQGQPPSAPSAGPDQGPGASSSTGMSADDMRRAAASQAQMAS